MDQRDIKILSPLAEIIRKEGAITKGNLWKKSSITIHQFNKYYSLIPIVYTDIKFDVLHDMFYCRNLSLSLQAWMHEEK